MNMAWRDTLNGLRDELADVRAERQQQAREVEAEKQLQREELTKLADALGVTQLLNEMNSVLLSGLGKIEVVSSWEDGEENEDLEELPMLYGDLDDDAEEGDLFSAILTWEEDGEREIAVDLGFAEQGAFLQVNEVDIRPEQQALEQALVEAFREELEL
jgi:hypothetical protein